MSGSKEFDVHLFVQKLSDQVVRFYYNHNKSLSEDFQLSEDSIFTNSLLVVTGAAIVTVDCDEDRIFLYAIDPMELLRRNKNGKEELWDFLSNWVKEKFNKTLAIAKYDTSKKGVGVFVYDDTKNYLLSTLQMIRYEATTFEKAFLED